MPMDRQPNGRWVARFTEREDRFLLEAVELRRMLCNKGLARLLGTSHSSIQDRIVRIRKRQRQHAAISKAIGQ